MFYSSTSELLLYSIVLHSIVVGVARACLGLLPGETRFVTPEQLITCLIQTGIRYSQSPTCDEVTGPFCIL